MDKTSTRSDLSGFHPFWRGHLFLFDPTKAVGYTSKQGGQLLLIFILMELILMHSDLLFSVILKGFAKIQRRKIVNGSLIWRDQMIGLQRGKPRAPIRAWPGIQRPT